MGESILRYEGDDLETPGKTLSHFIKKGSKKKTSDLHGSMSLMQESDLKKEYQTGETVESPRVAAGLAKQDLYDAMNDHIETLKNAELDGLRYEQLKQLLEAQRLAKNRKRIMNMLLESEVKMTKLKTIAALHDQGTPSSNTGGAPNIPFTDSVGDGTQQSKYQTDEEHHAENNNDSQINITQID